MHGTIKQWMHALVFCLGLVSIAGGVATHISGAWVIGLVIAAVNIQQWHELHLGQSPAHKS